MYANGCSSCDTRRCASTNDAGHRRRFPSGAPEFTVCVRRDDATRRRPYDVFGNVRRFRPDSKRKSTRSIFVRRDFTLGRDSLNHKVVKRVFYIPEKKVIVNFIMRVYVQVEFELEPISNTYSFSFTYTFSTESLNVQIRFLYFVACC